MPIFLVAACWISQTAAAVPGPASKSKRAGFPQRIRSYAAVISFATCMVQPHQEDGFTVIDFSGGPGILNGQDFVIDLGTSGWQPNEEFFAFANPEPGTLSLFVIGLAPLLVRKIRQLGVRNR